MQITEQLTLAIREAGYLVVFTGAGISAESGIPTFRETLSGLWARFDPAELATREAFRRDPALVWGWYEWRRMELMRAQPNPAHFAIAKLARIVPKLTVITQNVDGLHERAGSSDVIHLHGSIQMPCCFACGRGHDLAEHSKGYEVGLRIEPPRCRRCSGKIRPGVVWFGESLPDASIRAAFDAARHCGCLLSIGTSSVVQPAARIPHVALEHGATVIHINPATVNIEHPREFYLQGMAGNILPELVRQAFRSVG